jgi:predicted dehydrogenase
MTTTSPNHRPRLRFGLVGLGLMGREMACAMARYCQLVIDGPVPELVAVCDREPAAFAWFQQNFGASVTCHTELDSLLRQDGIDAIYCAIPHRLHESAYTSIIAAGKHLLGEKPFGIDAAANQAILDVIARHPQSVVRCSSEFPYFPAARRVVDWLVQRRYGRLIEVRVGFLHAGDLDPSKPISWKRQQAENGAYGCLGDLGMHTLHIPMRMGWQVQDVFADLRKLYHQRPDGRGGMAVCDTWDNGVLMSTWSDNGQDFPLIMQTKRIAPGATNTWYIEVDGTEGSIRFSTTDAKAFQVLESTRPGSGWMRVETGSQSYLPSVTGGIFEFGFSDALLQMLGAFMQECAGKTHPFGPVRPEETALQHRLFSAALISQQSGRRERLKETLS